MLAAAHASTWVTRGLLLGLVILVVIGLRSFGLWLQRTGTRIERQKRGDPDPAPDDRRAEPPNPFGE